MFRKILFLVAGACISMAPVSKAQVTVNFSRYVSSGTDDAEEAAPGGTGTLGAMDLTSTDVELMTDGTKKQFIGIRFQNITIPQGSVIQHAYIQFATKGDKNPTLGDIVIKGQNVDNAATFTTGSFNVSSRTVTADTMLWIGSTSSTWGTTAGGTRGPNQKTPDLKDIVQAVVNRSGWASGNALAMILKGEGVRNAYTYDGSSTLAPELIIEYLATSSPLSPFPVNAKSTWRFSDGGVLPAANWKDTSYMDVAWTTGSGKLGYSDNANTVVSYGTDANNKFITTYFRYNLDMTNTAQYDSLIFRVLRDDGCVVYVNGIEVFRQNMPTGPVTNATLAATDLSGPEERAYFSKTIVNSLVNGKNTIAVEVHQSTPSSDDLGFDMIVTGKQLTPMAITSLPINKNSQWYYFDDGNNQDTMWRTPGFYPGTWNYGVGKLGYSDAPATTMQFGPESGNKYITYYFRKQFNVTSVAALSDSLSLNILRDDGVIVYVNGTEVVRSNIPAGPVDYQTWSTVITDGPDESTYFPYFVQKAMLVNGINTIAVELHQRDGTSSDIGFDLELKEIGLPQLLRGPYLQVATPTSMNIRWRTDVASNSVVHYGLAPNNLSSTVTDTAVVANHEIKLTGLAPYTKYYYSVGHTQDTLQGDTNNYFKTLPVTGTEQLYRIGVFGDCGNNSTNQVNVRNQMINYLDTNYMNAWILLGDNAYSSGTDAEFQAEFFNIYKDRFLKQNPLFPAPGNHDYSNGSSTAQANHQIPYYSMFSMPTQAEAGGTPSNSQAFYSFNIGNAHFLSLDSYGKEDAGTTRMYDTLGAQVQWIKSDLAANTNKDWVIAYWHHPPYTMGSHNSDSESELVNIRQNFVRILERMGVDLILTGHSHDYERSRLMQGHYSNEASFNAATHNLSSSSALYDGTANSCPYIKDSVTNYQGTVYVVSGSAGQLGGQQSSFPHAALSAYSNATNGGSMILEVQGNRLDAKWICADGVIRDKFTMMKDAKVNNTYNINQGNSVVLTAGFNGNYTWLNSSATTKSITVSPADTTMYVVNASYSCISDTFIVNVLVSTPLSANRGYVKAWQKDSRTNLVQWETLSELNSSRFDIERSVDGSEFSRISQVNAGGRPYIYNYEDSNLPAGSNVFYYRIKEIDLDGGFRMSKTVKVTRGNNHADLDVIVAPNPARNNEMYISVNHGAPVVGHLSLRDAYGKLVFSKETVLDGTPRLFLPELAKGWYILNVTTDGKQINKKIIIQ